MKCKKSTNQDNFFAGVAFKMIHEYQKLTLEAVTFSDQPMIQAWFMVPVDDAKKADATLSRVDDLLSNGEMVDPARSQRKTIGLLMDLLQESLDCVEASEQAQRESWPNEIESGKLILDLGDRIRAVLGALGVPGYSEADPMPAIFADWETALSNLPATLDTVSMWPLE